ncbi:RNA polymerase sigma-70 factor [Marinilabiliaceae bacterium JC017]|nr:RNA polymerase sigma-70 factor [Marinilabiliaceae bacterium JC017]
MGYQTSNNEANPLQDPVKFKSFFNEFFPVLVVFARRYVVDDEPAHDIAQEAFITAWEKRLSIKNLDDVRFYLYTIVRNKCLNYLKHIKVKRVHEQEVSKENDIYFETVTIEQETFLMLKKAIGTLAPKTQEIINLSLQGLGNNDISEQLDISVNTVKTMKRRAFKKLSQQLKDHFYLFFI